jgi:hypothetical protein
MPNFMHDKYFAVHDKLCEARFFLAKLAATTAFDDCRYYLSAYLNATYSVRDILHDHFKANANWAAWRDAQLGKFSKIWAARHLVTHEGNNKLHFAFEVTNAAFPGEALLFKIDGTGAMTLPPDPNASVTIEIPKDMDENAVTILGLKAITPKRRLALA